MRPTVVFDTNILFSWTGWKGAPYRCVEMARGGAIHHVTCQEILEEFSEKLDSKLRFSDEQITKTMLDLIEFTDVVGITNTLRVVLDDPKDDMVIECAVVGKANFVIYGFS
ncbi:MAG: putative toxin-antitoxin system toxin component, PIN family [Bacteroidetes bacterium]|nr:putative toxin-antitoxin system toxin component, PIN family [Bacteroidota bacterium]